MIDLKGWTREDHVATMRRRSGAEHSPDPWQVIARRMREDVRAADRQFWAIAGTFLAIVFGIAAVSLWRAHERERPEDVAAECRAQHKIPVQYRGAHDELLAIRCEAMR